MKAISLKRLHKSTKVTGAVLAFTIGLLGHSQGLAARYDGQLTITTIDEETGQKIPVRMELRDGRGRPVRVKASEAVSHGDYFVFDGEVSLQLPQGPYRFLIEAGPEYQTRPGHFTIERNAEDTTEVVLQRRVDMEAEGWYAADLDVGHDREELPLLMHAAGVDLATVLVQENRLGRCRTSQLSRQLKTEEASNLPIPLLMASLDNRRGGGLLLLNPDKDLNICQWKTADSSLPLLKTARESGACVVALSSTAWDLPLWIAQGDLDAIQISHRHSFSEGNERSEEQGRPRDKTFFPGSLGKGRWSEAIYHHVLNCGLRIPPAGSSGSGHNESPVGTNRVYAYCGDDFSQENWLTSLRSGQVMVTGGPLLRTSVEGYPPGRIFEIDSGATREFQIGLSLTFYEKAPVEYLEIIKNGRVEVEVRLDELAKRQGRLPPVTFDESGWFAVRARTNNTQTYQFATTGPYYVEAGYRPRISRTSVEFFLDWLDEAAQQFSDNEAVLADIDEARPFWQELLQQANAE